MVNEVDEFYAQLDQWGSECRKLRELVLASGLTEALKWKQPCYTHGGKNVAMVTAFKNYASLSFFQGVLLNDDAGVLTTPGKDSQSARQWRFGSVDEVVEQESRITAYLAEAVGHIDAGTQVEFTAKDKLELPVELLDRFDSVDGLEDAFMALTPGRQRGYVLNIGGAKQAATRAGRVDKHLDRILAGFGIHDCYCGRSARMPRCDGTHSK